MKADEYQVGGDHYRRAGGEAHWDRMVSMYGLDQTWAYFAFNATAYLERHRLKHVRPDGTLDLDEMIKDVRKAAHYATKLAELYEAERNKEKL